MLEKDCQMMITKELFGYNQDLCEQLFNNLTLKIAVKGKLLGKNFRDNIYKNKLDSSFVDIEIYIK